MKEIGLAKATYGPMLFFTADQVIGHALATTGQFQESKITEVVHFLTQRFNFAPELFVDIGANIGTHLIFALKNSAFARGIGLEPDPNNFSLLSANIAMHQLCDRVLLKRIAVTDFQGVVELEISESNYGDHRVRTLVDKNIISHGEENRQVILVPATTIDAVLKETGCDFSRTLVWIDTQGHEGTILPSLLSAKTDPVSNGYVVMEFWPYGLHRNNNLQGVLNFLAQSKAVYDINRPNWQNSPPVSLDWLTNYYTDMLAATRPDYYPHTDLLCIV